MERITRQNLDTRADFVSTMLRGSLHVEAQGRSGYIGLDLYDAHGCVRTLATGTKREIYAYLGAMLDALEIVGR